MCLNTHDTFCIATNDNLEELDKKLKLLNFRLVNNFYTLEIYMKEDSDKISIKTKDDLKNYIVICDFNNEKNTLTVYNEGKVTGIVKGIFSTKELLKKLNYTEMFHINTDVYEYVNEKNEKIEILDLKKYGVYLKILNTENTNSTEKLFKLLKELNLDCNLSNIYIDILDEVIKKEYRGR